VPALGASASPIPLLILEIDPPLTRMPTLDATQPLRNPPSASSPDTSRRVALASAALLSLLYAALANCAAAPPGPSFDAAGSDPRALAVADATLERMGGRRAWNRVRGLHWKFFGKREHWWDKRTGEYLLVAPKLRVRMNLESGVGTAWEDEQLVVDDARRTELLGKARSIWINDSYWLLMPYKLKDGGVTLGYKGVADLAADSNRVTSELAPPGRLADVLTVTFRGVGDTPQNRYEVWVARETGLVERWDYFETVGDERPRLSTPWTDWREYEGVWLSGGRGENRWLEGLAVTTEEWPELRNWHP
jgi:hypothetical protein